MPNYKIVFARSARKELENLPKSIVQRIIPKIEDLAKSPRPSGCRKIKGAFDLWRIRVGDYRIVYSVSDTTRTVDVIRIRHRRNAYE